MSGQTIRNKYMVKFVGMTRYKRWIAWTIVASYIAMVVAAAGLGHYLLSLPLTWLTVLAMALIMVFIGTRLRGLNNIVHECSHSSFSEHRGDNTAIGRVCSALLVGCFRSYKDDHLSHHAHLGDYERDAEFGAIESLRLHDPLTPRTVLRHILTPLTGRHLKMYSRLNFSGEDGSAFFALKIGSLAAIAAVAIVAPLTALMFLILPLFFIFPTLNFWTDCLDHAGLVGEEDELEASRNVLAPGFIRLLFFPRNDCYHLVHHLFPQVPARHLDKVHQELCEDPEYRTQPQAAAPTHFGIGGLLNGAVSTGTRADT